MGCFQSKSKGPDELPAEKSSEAPTQSTSSVAANKGGKTLQKRISKGPLSLVEIQKRIDVSLKVKTVCKNGLTLRYAYLSQRGYYPEGYFFLTIIFS
jgi:hypothetical protein